MVFKKKENNIKIYSILFLIGIFLFLPNSLEAQALADKLVGRILLQVEDNGEAWYIYPKNYRRYYLGRPRDAFNVMRNLGLGAKSDIIGKNIFPSNLAGMILLDVEKNGETYYIDPLTLKKHYLGRPDDAFLIMRQLGLGIKNNDLNLISRGDIDAVELNFHSSYLENVPFTSQAPYFDWADKRQQDGCEEASALMAVKWAREEDLNKNEALQEILKASDYLKDTYGEYRDISINDANLWILNDYFNYRNTKVLLDVTVKDIIDELGKGNLVIAPFNGQLLNNPHFTGAGPERHMLVIRGYDAKEDVFITNDPGTRYGENYKYSTDILFNAIRDYATGYHKAINEVRKNIIIISK